MSKHRNLLQKGNSKLGEAIHTWSLPAIDTCPGRTNLCARVCYATGGRFRTHLMRDRLQDNLDESLRSGFEHKIVKEINRRDIRTLRIHVAGDYFDPEYAMKWVRIARRCERTTLYTYSRSWRLPEFREVFDEMARLKNFHLWFSVDSESGMPEYVPDGVRLAFMQTVAEDDPGEVELVFRIPQLRESTVRRIGLAVVCPTENGAPSADDKTCTSCRRCFS